MNTLYTPVLFAFKHSFLSIPCRCIWFDSQPLKRTIFLACFDEITGEMPWKSLLHFHLPSMQS